jgi:hypothetical protein
LLPDPPRSSLHSHLLPTDKSHISLEPKDKVRSTFKSESEITTVRLKVLQWLLAVLKEALRIYPQFPGETQRVTPLEGCMIDGRFVLGNTSAGINHSELLPLALELKHTFEFLPQRMMGDA